jgi:hypothetical protein
MFVHSEWEKICQELQKYHTIRADELLAQESNSSWVVVKHDVETQVSKALELAKIEARYGICATYFVQADLLEDGAKVLQEIAQLGHEVTYHYDVLDANGGDMVHATEMFRSHLEAFLALGFKVKSVCPHGNPMMNREGWNSNKDFFRDKSIVREFDTILDIVVQLPYMLKDGYRYISDTGYGWRAIANIADNDIANHGDISLAGTEGLFELLKSEKRVILSTHPHRWESSSMQAYFNLYRFKVLRWTANTLAVIPPLKWLMSKFYFLAKKV